MLQDSPIIAGSRIKVKNISAEKVYDEITICRSHEAK